MFDIPLHKLIIHFPIALAIVAFAYDGWAVYSKRPEMHDTGYGLTLWAAVTALFAIVTGLQIAGLGGISKGAITGHALLGMFTTAVLVALGMWRYSSRSRQEGPDEDYMIVWLIMGGLAAVLVVATAIAGHRLMFG
jgi:uncharacterized membrane protein